jgi:hypothetical protein
MQTSKSRPGCEWKSTNCFFRNYNKTGSSAAPASIRGTIDLQAVGTGLSVEVLLGEAVERFLDREAAVGVVHVVVDDQIVKLLRLPGGGGASGSSRTLHSPNSSGGVLPFTQGSPVFISVNEIGHDLFGAVSIGGSGAPTGPSMQGWLDGGETPVGPTKMFVAPMSAKIAAAWSRGTGLPVSTSPCRIRIGMVSNF